MSTNAGLRDLTALDQTFFDRSYVSQKKSCIINIFEKLAALENLPLEAPRLRQLLGKYGTDVKANSPQ